MRSVFFGFEFINLKPPKGFCGNPKNDSKWADVKNNENKRNTDIELHGPNQAAYKKGQEAELLQTLLRSLDLGVAIFDENLDYQLISDAVFKTLGLGKTALKVGDNLSRCHELMLETGHFTQEILEDNHLSVQEALEREANETTESQLLRLGDGSYHRFVRKHLDNNQTVSIAHNVTELVGKQKMLDKALALGNAGYWVYDFATKKYLLSETLLQYFSKNALERIDTHGIIAIVHPEDRQKFRDAIGQLNKKNNRFQVTSRTLTINGNERWSQTTGEIQRDTNGKPVRIEAFVKDVTRERRQAQELERAKDEAIAASMAKSEFLANMSHEIRTPMNGILGMAELLANSEISERQQDFVNVINNSASALLTIINDILDFSKIEAGAFEIDPMPFDLKSSLNDVTSLLRQHAHAKGLEMIINYPPTLPRGFVGDAGRIRQVVTNLVGNAIKFTNSGHVTINVDVRTNRGKGIVSLEIIDTGIGIPKEKLVHIFDKFTQADSSTTRLYGGTGLGLTISRRIIELMDGRMNARSEFGKGSVFSVQLPLALDPDAKRQSYDLQTIEGRRALIIDDIETNRRVLSEQLHAWKVETETAEDGVYALRKLEDAEFAGAPFDFILLDFLMPGMNGEEFARMLQQKTGLTKPPILMLSSCDQPITSAGLKENGIDAYLVKPVREKRLFETIVKTLSQQTEAGEVVSQIDVETLHAHDELGAASLAILPPAVQTEDDGIVDLPLPLASRLSVMQNNETPDTDNGKQEILVAEDFALNQDVMRLMLADSPFSPVFANNGREAVEVYQNHPDRFPLVIMDVSMPEMDGFEATMRIRDYERRADITPVPIIALTGHALKNDRQKCLDAGMTDYLTKPVKQIEIIDKLETYTVGAIVSSANQVA